MSVGKHKPKADIPELVEAFNDLKGTRIQIAMVAGRYRAMINGSVTLFGASLEDVRAQAMALLGIAAKAAPVSQDPSATVGPAQNTSAA